ncbi:hypothetical protein TRVA0_030S00298 [Trichomonascus vanleenenianus]|uniref:uncharacterized protein n=1 Tax=Trichomonascus vanleenenianus TaxID=2268995 RepID=UPI003ECB922E
MYKGAKLDEPQVTPRAIAAGLAIGSVVLFSNFFFGLQTGWVSMMGLPSSLLGFAIFKSLQKRLSYPFTDVENVFIQSLAVAVGTGPLAFGFVGVIPAIEKFLTPAEAALPHKFRFSMSEAMVWSAGLAFFGVFFAVLLRTQIIRREKLRFPSGTATAILITVLHKTRLCNEDELDNSPKSHHEEPRDEEEHHHHHHHHHPEVPEEIEHDEEFYEKNIGVLTSCFTFSSLYTLAAYFVPILRDLPLFGNYLAKHWLWTFQPSPAYVGQGIIIGLPTVSSMLLGAVLGWAVLAPLAYHNGWAVGPIDDWKTGAQGWILWVSLAVMVADAVVSFIAISAKSLYSLLKPHYHKYRALSGSRESSTISIGDDEDNEGDDDFDDEEEYDEEEGHEVSYKVALIGLGLSLIACIGTTHYVFDGLVPVYATLMAVVLALFLSVLAIRALGETDLNPVSGIGKISQVLFALVIPRDHPGSVLINLVAGGITEAGAQQAGDLMQDLKTGHLIGASPKAQFVAQMIGSTWSVVLSSLIYRLYDTVYDIPGHLFRIPTAVIWIDCSRLVTGDGLPPHVDTFAYLFGAIFAILAAIRVIWSHRPWVKYIPSGVAVGIGIYNVPSFTLARFIGGCIANWYDTSGHTDKVWLIILSSGLVLGEGVTSIVSLIFTALGVPHL